MEWKDFKEERKGLVNGYFITSGILTDINCPECGEKIYKDMTIILTSNPPKHQYSCKCGWKGISY